MSEAQDLIEKLTELAKQLRPAPNQAGDEKRLRLEEWKECRKSIARFDQIIVDLRKYGFSLVTILLSASGFLYASTSISPGGILGVYLALSLLIGALFCVDRYHEIFLRGAVERSKELEKTSLDMGLSEVIEQRSENLRTGTWGVGIYLLFCVANYFLVVGAVLDFQDWTSLRRSIMQPTPFLAVATVFAAIAIIGIFIYHKSRKPKEQG